MTIPLRCVPEARSLEARRHSETRSPQGPRSKRRSPAVLVAQSGMTGREESPPLLGGERVLRNAGRAVEEIARRGEPGTQQVQADVEQRPLPLADLSGDDHA